MNLGNGKETSGIDSISIVYEDEEILAINKPSGVLMHAAESESPVSRIGGTVADWVLARYPEMAHVGEPQHQFSRRPKGQREAQREDWCGGEPMTTPKGAPILRPGIVHRLDKDTSGIVVLAKTQDVFNFLKKQFQGREIKKEYKVIVHGIVKENEGSIDLPIARSAGDFRRKSTRDTARGAKREALTKFKTEARSDDMSFLSVFPKTGRTHQIRVHMEAIGHPVVCDELYAAKRVCPLELSRLALHAFAIELEAPATAASYAGGQKLRLEAPLAEDMARFAIKHFPGLHIDE